MRREPEELSLGEGVLSVPPLPLKPTVGQLGRYKMDAREHMWIRRAVTLLLLLFIAALLLAVILPSSPFRPNVKKLQFFTLDDSNSLIGIDGTIQIDFTNGFPQNLSITYNFIRPGRHTPEISKVCLETVEIVAYISQGGFFTNTWSKEVAISRLDNRDSLCYDYGSEPEYMQPHIIFEGTVNFDLGQQEVTNYYVYPFDEIFVAPHPTITMSLFDSSGELVDTLELPAAQGLEILIPGWVASTRYDSQVGTGIVLRRSLVLRVIIPAFLVLLFLVTLAIPFIDSLSSAAEVAVSLVFGVWGIRQIIFSTEPPSLTAVEIILLGEYFAIVLALSVFPMRSVLEKMKRPQVVDEHQSSKGNPDGHGSSGRKPDYYFSFHDSKIYHFADCPHLARGKNVNTILSFQEIGHAKDSGRRLCRACASRHSYHRKQK